MKLKVWTNDGSKNVLRIVEPLLNPIHTNLCTEERHAKCLKEGRCDACKPRCEDDKWKMVGISPYSNKIIPFSIEKRRWDAHIKQENERDAKIKQILKRLMHECKPYILTIEPIEVVHDSPTPAKPLVR